MCVCVREKARARENSPECPSPVAVPSRGVWVLCSSRVPLAILRSPRALSEAVTPQSWQELRHAARLPAACGQVEPCAWRPAGRRQVGRGVSAGAHNMCHCHHVHGRPACRASLHHAAAHRARRPGAAWCSRGHTRNRARRHRAPGCSRVRGLGSRPGLCLRHGGPVPQQSGSRLRPPARTRLLNSLYLCSVVNRRAAWAQPCVISVLGCKQACSVGSALCRRSSSAAGGHRSTLI